MHNFINDMEIKQETLKFESFIRLSEVSAQRSRSLISILMVATFVSLLALYNSLPVDQNWLYSRLRSLQAAELWMAFDARGNSDTIYLRKDTGLVEMPNSFEIREMIIASHIVIDHKLDTNQLPDFFKIPHKHISMRFPKYAIIGKTVHLELIDYEQLGRAMHYLTGEKVVNSKEELERVIAYLNKSIIDNSLSIKIPILGIAFDVNSLAIISAVAFSIIFFLLYFYLMRERKNLILLFELADELHISKIKIYQLLSMNQVLTVPGSIDEYIIAFKKKQPIPKIEKVDRKFKINQLMTLAPMVFASLVWITIIIFDIKSMTTGTANNASLTILNYIISGIFGIIMFYFLHLTFTEWRELNNVWEEQRSEVKEIFITGGESGLISDLHTID